MYVGGGNAAHWSSIFSSVWSINGRSNSFRRRWCSFFIILNPPPPRTFYVLSWTCTVFILMNLSVFQVFTKYTCVSTQNFVENSDLIFFKVNYGHQRSNLGQIRSIEVKSGRLVHIYQICICFDSEFCREFRFIIFQGQLGSSEVKLGSNPPNRGQIGSVGPYLPDIHMFRLGILSRIQI